MSKYLQDKRFYSFNVSTLSHSVFCPVRSKIEVLNKNSNFSTPNKVMRIGTRMHELYLFPNKSFNRVLCRARLRKYSIRKYDMDIFSKEVKSKGYTIRVSGAYDDVRIIRVGDKKYSVLVEIKTTSKKYMWSHEVNTAKKQLQLYMWLLKELLDLVKFPLWKRGYVEIYSQKTGNLIKAIPVEYDNNIEEWIKYTVECYMGLKPIRIPDLKLCRYCPSHIRKVCNWYKIRRGNKNVI